MSHRLHLKPFYLAALLLLLASIAACQGQRSTTSGDQNPAGERLEVVTTTTIVGDIVRAVGGEQIDLQILLPPGADPHTYEASPRDVAAINEADLVFINGLGLESLIEPLLQEARKNNRVVQVSDGIEVLIPKDDEYGGTGDPHVWFDPTRVSVWVDNIEEALSQADPENGQAYRNNAANYRWELQELDRWIEAQIAQIPPVDRLLLTDHDSLGYLADRYDLELVGTIIPGFDTQAEPAAKELAELINLIENRRVAAVLVSDAVNPAIAKQITIDTGTALVPITTGSLSEAGGETSTYLEFMRMTVRTISDALRGSK